MCMFAKAAGYRVGYEVVNARCLTAQSRKRLYIVGVRVEGKGVEGVSSDDGGEKDKHPNQSEGLGSKQGTKEGEGRGGEVFEFPFIPDLRLRAGHILQVTTQHNTHTHTHTNTNTNTNSNSNIHVALTYTERGRNEEFGGRLVIQHMCTQNLPQHKQITYTHTKHIQSTYKAHAKHTHKHVHKHVHEHKPT